MSLSDYEVGQVNYLLKRLKGYAGPNHIKKEYVEGKNRIKDLKISIPPQLKNIKTSVGWAKVVIDCLEERLDFQGWVAPDAFGLDKIYKQNNLANEAPIVHDDSLTYGIGFAVLGRGNVDLGEPEVLITMEPTSRMTGNYNLRTRRLDSAISISHNEKGEAVTGALYLPNETVYFEIIDKQIYETDRDVHNFGFVPVVEFINDKESGSTKGHSQLTESIISHINGAERTLLAMTVASEFFSAPQRYIIGTEQDPFVDSDGQPIADAWSAILGRVLALPANEATGNNPSVGQFSANSPAPFIEQVKLYASLISAETGIPSSMLGLQDGGNPQSSEAMNVGMTRLIKTAERKQTQFSTSWLEIARLALIIRDGFLPEGWEEIGVKWGDPATPTVAARADAILKLVSVGVIDPQDPILLDKLQMFSQAEIESILQSRIKSNSQATITNALALAASNANAPITNKQL